MLLLQPLNLAIILFSAVCPALYILLRTICNKGANSLYKFFRSFYVVKYIHLSEDEGQFYFVVAC